MWFSGNAYDVSLCVWPFICFEKTKPIRKRIAMQQRALESDETVNKRKAQKRNREEQSMQRKETAYQNIKRPIESHVEALHRQEHNRVCTAKREHQILQLKLCINKSGMEHVQPKKISEPKAEPSMHCQKESISYFHR